MIRNNIVCYDVGSENIYSSTSFMIAAIIKRVKLPPLKIISMHQMHNYIFRQHKTKQDSAIVKFILANLISSIDSNI